MYQIVKRMQNAMTPLTTMSSWLRFFLMLSISPFNPGTFPAIFNIVPWIPLNDAPCDLKSDLISSAWPKTESAAFRLFPMALRSLKRCSMAGSSLPPELLPAIPAPWNSSMASLLRATDADAFLKSALESNNTSLNLLTKIVCCDLPVRSAAGANRRSTRSVMVDATRDTSAARADSSSSSTDVPPPAVPASADSRPWLDAPPFVKR
mmetsp:Transcript_25636/g.52488  ORF Transcript_25636/g.52488 Transcript_25636/m.52488 type:complete len:207 (-) Transcript_25636:172-792(-)